MRTLRPYQSDIVDRVRNAYLHGYKAPCVVLPCGGGKSVIVAEIAKRTTAKQNHVLFLVHRKELVDQIQNTFDFWGVDMNYADIMMVQTASRRIERLQMPALIITDEGHHVPFCSVPQRALPCTFSSPCVVCDTKKANVRLSLTMWAIMPVTVCPMQTESGICTQRKLRRNRKNRQRT